MRIAAICATPRGNNTGMRCVDGALALLLDQTQLGSSVDYYCFDLPETIADVPDALAYRPITAFPGHDRYRAVILWGDFILSDTWLEQMVRHISKRESRPEAEIRAHVYDTLFPGPGVRTDTIVFGQSLQFGDDKIFHNEPYLTRLRHLLTTARLARVRDPVSAYRAGIITGLSPNKFAGVDAALLLDALNPAPKETDRSADVNQVGIFFYRTKGAQIAHLGLASALRRVRGLRCAWIPWLPTKSMPAWIKMVFGIRGSLVDGANPSVADYIKAIRSCRFIVTDTYHLTLLAWSNGVPAICIGKGAQHFEHTTHDKKKEVFYNSNYLNDYYLFTERSGSDFLHGKYRRCVERAIEADSAKSVQARLKAMALENLASLKAVLEQL
jgi:hypothetical protein